MTRRWRRYRRRDAIDAALLVVIESHTQAKIKATVVKDGLKWSEGLKLVDVAFGVQKIICTAVVNQTLSMDAIIEEITEELFTEEVQSMSMTSMSLL